MRAAGIKQIKLLPCAPFKASVVQAKKMAQLPLSVPMSSADDRPNFFNFFKNSRNSIFHCHIWIQHEKCIQMSTNKPSIGSVVLKIAL